MFQIFYILKISVPSRGMVLVLSIFSAREYSVP